MAPTSLHRREDGGKGLRTLASEINAAHSSAERALNDALAHARRCGEPLNEARELCAHGEWGAWLAENFAGSDRTARQYMMIARRWPELQANRHGRAEMTLTQARDLLAEPREPAAPSVMRADEARELTRRINAQLADPEVRAVVVALADVRDNRLYRNLAPSFGAWCADHGISAELLEVMTPLLDAAAASA